MSMDRDVGSRIRNNPWSAAAIAAPIGLLIGKMADASKPASSSISAAKNNAPPGERQAGPYVCSERVSCRRDCPTD
jgi:hypothetical protein